MDTNHNDRRDAHGNGNARRTLKMDTGSSRSLTSDFGLDAEGYPVEPPAVHYDRGGEA